jgi:hypothetical protein
MEARRHHINDTHHDRDGRSLCGIDVRHLWSFINVDHAFHSIRSGSFNVPCKRCARIVISQFRKES